jgi:hypothetical protein
MVSNEGDRNGWDTICPSGHTVRCYPDPGIEALVDAIISRVRHEARLRRISRP